MNQKIVLGTVQLGIPYGINNTTGVPSSKEAEAILTTCWNNDIRTLDTASSYGSSQQLIGDYLRKNPDRPFRLISKFIRSTELPKDTLAQFEDTLKTLGVSHLEGYLFHRIADFLNPELRAILTDLRSRGVVNQIGVSVYDNLEALQALSVGGFDILQLPFNLLDNWKLRGEVISRAHKNGMSVHVRSVFLQGLFLKNLKILPPKLAPLVEQLKSIHTISKYYGIDIQELAIRYALSFSEIDHVLIGVEKERQLLDNLRHIKNALPPEVLQDIHKIKIAPLELLDPRTWS